MKKYLIGAFCALSLIVIVGYTFVSYDISEINWGYNAGDGNGHVLRAYEWVNFNGTMNLQVKRNQQPTRYVLWPAGSASCETDPFCPNSTAPSEIVLMGAFESGGSYVEQLRITSEGVAGGYFTIKSETVGMTERPMAFCNSSRCLVIDSSAIKKCDQNKANCSNL